VRRLILSLDKVRLDKSTRTSAASSRSLKWLWLPVVMISKVVITTVMIHKPIVLDQLSFDVILILGHQFKESCKMSVGRVEIMTIVMVNRILWSTISIRVFLLYTSPSAYSQNTVSSTIWFYHPLLSLSSFFSCVCAFLSF